jgi:hypothetical protein
MPGVMEKPLFLFAPSDPSTDVVVSSSATLPKMIGGQPVTYLWRKSIKLGDYKHPATGQQFSVTPQRVEKWISNFRKMKSNGHAVYVPLNHSTKTEDNRGFVLDMRANGPWLEELHQYIGDDAARDAARSKVSLLIRPNLKDSAGNVYDEAIEHSSLVVNPVILGQDEPAIAASAAAGEAKNDQPGETFVLCACQDKASASQVEYAMNLTDAQVAALKKVFGDDLTPENLIERAGAQKTQLSAAQSEVGTLRLSATPVLTGPSLNAMKVAAERAAAAAVAAGAIVPAVRDKLIKRLVAPAADKVNGLALSASGIEGSDIPLALGIFEDLAENKPIQLGTLTGAQQVINRQVPGAEATGEDAAIAELEKQSREYATSQNRSK